MFIENSHSLAMITHSMKVINFTVQHVNPSQIAVIAVDQLLFALAQKIQWTLGNVYSEDQCVVMLGGRHIEMAAFKMVNGSGWTEALCNAGVATQGVADSLLTASHLTRTRRAHQVTAASLHLLKDTMIILLTLKRMSRPSPFQEWKEEVPAVSVLN